MDIAEGRRSPVVSLTVIDGRSMDAGVLEPSSRVLVVARSAEANLTHPNVLSVPTQRIPRALFEDILNTADPLGYEPTRAASYFCRGEVESDSCNGHHPIVYATDAVLTRKLGLAESLEGGDLRYRAALRAQVDSAAAYDNLAPEIVYEPISMLNIVVELTSAQDELPLCTASYSPMAWAAASQFMAGVQSRDPTFMGTALDPIELCVHGVCLSAACASLTHLMNRAPFTPEAPREARDPIYLRPRPSSTESARTRTGDGT